MIDGLPFSTEGYELAKNILHSNYGNINEIMHAYVENIRNLPVIAGTQAAKIHEFYHTHVQRAVFGNPGQVIWLFVYGERCLRQTASHRGHKDWQSWDFANLLRALQNWKEIHPISESSKKPEGGQKSPHDRSFQLQEQNL